MNIKKTTTLILTFALLSIYLVSCDAKNESSTVNSTPVINKLEVDAIITKEEILDDKTMLPGYIIPNKEISIVSELSKKLTGVLFEDGQTVVKDQPLFKLDDSDIKARLKEVETQLTLLKLTEQRLSKLLNNEAIKLQEYDEALTNLKSMEAKKELLLIELSKTEIKAPFSGKMGITKYSEGAFVHVGTPLVNIYDTENIRIEFYSPEKYLERIKSGNVIDFTTEQTLELRQAKIRGIEHNLSSDTRSLKVQAYANNPDNTLIGGMSAKVFLLSTDNKGIFLPTESLMASENGYSVYVVKNGVAKHRNVKLGYRSEEKAVITEGLIPGDTVIISNTLRTAEDMPVMPLIK